MSRESYPEVTTIESQNTMLSPWQRAKRVGFASLAGTVAIASGAHAVEPVREGVGALIDKIASVVDERIIDPVTGEVCTDETATWTVSHGENVQDIAEAISEDTNVTDVASRIIEENDLQQPHTIYVGNTLTVPKC